MLTDRITLSPTADPEPEDYLSTSLGVIFPDDITNQHGDSSTPVIYTSPTFGKIFLSLADPVGEGSRRLFAQYLWNAGVFVAVGLEDALTTSSSSSGDGVRSGTGMGGEMGTGTGARTERGRWMQKDAWDVRSETVLELGAGTGLAGIIAAKAGAKEVFITDYPAEEVLANLSVNVERNLSPEEQKRCYVKGHEWGFVPGFDDAQAEEQKVVHGSKGEGKSQTAHGMDFPKYYAKHFSRLLLADTLWMPAQHANLHRSISYFLSANGYAIVVAGFHTGRAKMAPFFDAQALAAVGLEVESIVEKDPTGREREWKSAERGNGEEGRENLSERKRWLVIAVLRRVGGQDGDEGERE